MTPPASTGSAPPLAPASTVVVAIAAATVAVLPVFLTGALTVQVRPSLHLTTGDIGIAVAAFFGASALCSATSGALAERAGSVVLMRAAAVVSAVALCGAALLADHLWSLALFLAVGGVGNGATQPAVNQLLTRAVRGGRQGLAFGVKQAAIPASTLLSGLAVPTLALTAGWRAAYLAAGVLAAAVTVGLHLLRHRLGASGSVGSGETVPDETVPDGDGRDGEDRPGRGWPPTGQDDDRISGQEPAPAGLAVRPLLVLAVAMAAAVAASNAMGAFMVPSAVAHGVAPAGLAGLLAAGGSVTGLTARITFGWLADIGTNRGVAAARRHLATVATLVAVGTLGYLALGSALSYLLVPATLLAFGAGWGYNGLFNLAVVRAFPEAPARATGITQIGTYIGGMVGPLGFGLLVDHQGYDLAWTSCALMAAVGAGVFVLARRSLGTGQVPAVARA